jgi:hypothetical protein
VWAKSNNKAVRLVDTLTHPTKPLAVATPDRAVYPLDSPSIVGVDPRILRSDVRDAECLLQIKSTNWRQASEWGEQGTDSIPTEYLCQAHWEGSVAGLTEVVFAVDLDKTELRNYRVRVSQEAFERLYAIAERFMVDHVKARRPPLPDCTDHYAEYLGRVFPKEETEALTPVTPGAEPELEELISHFIMLREAGERLKKWKDHCYNSITSRIAHSSGLQGAFGKLTWRRTNDSLHTDWELVAREALTLAELAVNSLPRDPSRDQLIATVRGLMSKHTEIKSGYRSLRCYPKKEYVQALGLDAPFSVELDPYDKKKKPKAAKQLVTATNDPTSHLKESF